MHIEYPVESVDREFSAVIKEFATHARLQGFRPGKAPLRLVRSKFAKQIREEVRDRLLPQGYKKALEQEGLRPVAVLDVEEDALQEGLGFAFHVMCDVPPVFELPTYKGLEIPVEKGEVTEDNVDAVLNQLRESEANYQDAARPVQEGDMVQVNYQGRCEKQPEKDQALAEVGVQKADAAWLLVDEKTYLPGFRDALLGQSPGAKIQVVSLYPDDFGHESLRGVEAIYDVDVLAVREKQLPEIDEAFLQRFKAESVEDLRRLVRESLEERAAAEARGKAREQIVRRLLSDTQLELPESEVQDETRETIYRMVRDVTSRGASEDELKQHKDELFESASRTAADRVKVRYILDRIAQAEEIDVTDAEFNEEVRGMAMQQRVEPEALRSYLREKNMVENVRQDVRGRKTLDFLYEQAVIVQ